MSDEVLTASGGMIPPGFWDHPNVLSGGERPLRDALPLFCLHDLGDPAQGAEAKRQRAQGRMIFPEEMAAQVELMRELIERALAAGAKGIIRSQWSNGTLMRACPKCRRVYLAKKQRPDRSKSYCYECGRTTPKGPKAPKHWVWVEVP